MTDVIKFAYTVFTVVSIFFSSFFCPADLLEQSENLDISFLEYPAEAIPTQFG